MSISSLNATAKPSTAPVTGRAAQQAAKAQYLRTGIDKDAAAGDPDHDAPRKVNLAPSAGSGPSTRLSASAVTVANAISTQAATPATARTAYTGKAG
jgi:hypothetical protein